MVRFLLPLLSIIFFLSCNSVNKEKKKISDTIGCLSSKITDKDWYSSGKRAPLLNGLEGIDFIVTTTNQEAQKYFNQGMMLSYGFNHAEAARSFFEAARIDSTCAMAYWGYAYVLGPNYNGGMEEDNYQRAYNAVRKAKYLSSKSTPKEIALINALEFRYEAQPVADRKHLDIAYATAMERVYKQYPSDPDIGALYAEALMNLHPWDLYDKESKKPQEWTTELVTVLEHLMKTNPKHPGAHHFYIHALEGSDKPEKALASAFLLDTLVPGAGHLVHMPSHIYINTGEYHLGTLSNLRAISVDSTYTTTCHAQGVYPLAYFPHNYHFLAATATLEGNSKLAWAAARKMQEHTATDIMSQPGWGTLQHYYIVPYYIAVKFGMWDSVLSLPAPPSDLVYPRSIWHYARGMAFVGKSNLSMAQREFDTLMKLATDTSLQHITIWDINTTADLVSIATKVLSASIAKKKNQPGLSVTLLKEAVLIEDHLNYNEPPDWFFSVRHYLGNTLIQNGRYREAESVYRQDLKTWKSNGWSLIGLHKALMLQKREKEAEVVFSAFNKAWQYADVAIVSSSF